ncbi:MAG TPA: hypothetical protein VIL82_00880 [Solirubrobacteraceae bacterium]
MLEQAGKSSFELDEDDLREDVKEIADETRARLEADADVLATLRRSSRE